MTGIHMQTPNSREFQSNLSEIKLYFSLELKTSGTSSLQVLFLSSLPSRARGKEYYKYMTIKEIKYEMTSKVHIRLYLAQHGFFCKSTDSW